MLYRLLEAHDGKLPPTSPVIFCNTGKEREETYEFVRDVSENMRVPVVWLEYEYRETAEGGASDPKNAHKVVDFDTASREGKPFEDLIRSRNMLPNQNMRMCTQELKVRTADRYLRRDLGCSDYRNVLGIRYDEPRRWFKATLDDCLLLYPLVSAGVTRKDVDEFWAKQDYDLAIPSWMGNCDLCFLKGSAILKHTIRQDPGKAQWWIKMEEEGIRMSKEREVSLQNIKIAQFRKTVSYKQLLAESEAVLPLEEISSSQSDQFEGEGVDCFCGD